MGNMPTNYKTTLFDNFSGKSLNSNNWPVTYGGNASNGAYSYSRSDISVGNGLTINTTDASGSWTTGGLSQGWNGGEYGLYQVEAKVDAGHGIGPNITLWPDNNSWPPEIDLLEAPNGTGNGLMSLHWAGSDGSNQYTSIGTGVSVNDWHDYAVDWEPNKLTFYVDGNAIWSTTDHIPNTPMGLGFSAFVAQGNDSWYGGGPNGGTPSTVGLHVAWASISEPGSGAMSNSLASAATDGASITQANTAAAAGFATTGDPTAGSDQTLFTSTGIDILQGGAGNDTFHADAASTDGWAEIDNWHAGDTTQFLGMDGGSTITWTDATDPTGREGATASISLHGDGHIDSAVTFAGVDASTMQNATTASTTYNGHSSLTLFG